MVARLWNFDATIATDYYNVLNACVDAFVDKGGVDPQGDATKFLEAIVGVAACQGETAKLLGPTDILDVLNPGGAPTVHPGKPCKQ